MGHLGDPPRRLERCEFFRRCSALERQRESLIIVGGLLGAEGGRGDVEILEGVSPPELLLIDSVAPLDFAVLLGALGRMYRWRIRAAARRISTSMAFRPAPARVLESWRRLRATGWPGRHPR